MPDLPKEAEKSRKESGAMIVWLLVTKDKYQLPLEIADSAGELARKVGCSTNNIYSAVSHAKHRGHNSRFVKVEIEEDEE